MYYELYIDIFFLTNFMMDTLLLLALKNVLKCPVRNGRVFLGGVAGAALTCLIVAVPMPGVFKFLLYHGGISVVMIRGGLNIRSRAGFCRAFCLLYVLAFLMGGILEALRPWIRTGSLFFAAAAGVYYILSGIWQGMVSLRERQKKICQVILSTKQRKYRVCALIDTGNGLQDPVSGDPVSVLDPACAKEMLNEEQDGIQIRYIPYRTVGGDGVMPVFRAEEMVIFLMREEKIQVPAPLIGICEGEISGQEDYQMILHPNLLIRLPAE